MNSLTMHVARAGGAVAVRAANPVSTTVLQGARVSSSAMFRRFSTARQPPDDGGKSTDRDTHALVPPAPPSEPAKPAGPWFRRGDAPLALDMESVAGCIDRVGETLKWSATAQASCEMADRTPPPSTAPPRMIGLTSGDAQLLTLEQKRPDLVTAQYLGAGHDPQYHLSPEQFEVLVERSPVVKALSQTATFQGPHVFPDVFNTAWRLMNPKSKPFKPTFIQNFVDVVVSKPHGFESRQLCREEILAAISEKGGAIVMGWGQLTAADSKRRWTENGGMLPDRLAQPGAWNSSRGRQNNSVIVTGHGGALGGPEWVVVFDQDPDRLIYGSMNHSPSTNPFRVSDELSSKPVRWDMAHHMFRVMHVDSLQRETAPIAAKPMLLVPTKPMHPPGHEPRPHSAIGQ